MIRTSTQDLQSAFIRFTNAASAAGLDIADAALQEGSQTYGRAYRLHRHDPQTGGLGSLYGTSDFLGMTKREAVLTLNGMTEGLRMTVSARFNV